MQQDFGFETLAAAGPSTLIASKSTLDTRLDMADRMTALFENVPKPRSLTALRKR